MAIDQDQPDVVREALEAADTVDGRGITVIADDDVIVLQGTVATFEEASAATSIAEQHADAVRSELRVDTNLREGGRDERPAPREDSTRSAVDGVEAPDDLVTDVQDSLDENVPWDPPDEAVQVPTRAEARGRADRSGGPDDDTVLGDMDQETR